MQDFIDEFNNVLWERLGVRPKSRRFANTRAVCKVPPGVVTARRLTAPKPGTLVEIAPHTADYDNFIMVPDLADLAAIEGCSPDDAQKVLDELVDHECLHVGVNEGIVNQPIGGHVEFVKDPPGAAIPPDPDAVAAAVYQEWCHDPINSQELKRENDLLDPPLMDFSGVPCTCATTQHALATCEKVCEPVWCPCNDPDHGEPRYYSDALTCSVFCPGGGSGLACFGIGCELPPDCP